MRRTRESGRPSKTDPGLRSNAKIPAGAYRPSERLKDCMKAGPIRFSAAADRKRRAALDTSR